MAMVRFATTCDVKPHAGDEPCGARSIEFEQWPTCLECSDHCCPEHQQPGTLVDADLDAPPTCLCLECARAEAAA